MNDTTGGTNVTTLNKYYEKVFGSKVKAKDVKENLQIRVLNYFFKNFPNPSEEENCIKEIISSCIFM